MCVNNLSFQLAHIKLVTDPRTRESRGFGFIGYETSEQATAAMENLNNVEIDGRKIIVEKVYPPSILSILNHFLQSRYSTFVVVIC
jgi:RNA recognition motif-containing protein